MHLYIEHHLDIPEVIVKSHTNKNYAHTTADNIDKKVDIVVNTIENNNFIDVNMKKVGDSIDFKNDFKIDMHMYKDLCPSN